MKSIKRNIMFGITAMALGMTLTGCDIPNKEDIERYTKQEIQDIYGPPSPIQTLYGPPTTYETEEMSKMTPELIYGPPSAFDSGENYSVRPLE